MEFPDPLACLEPSRSAVVQEVPGLVLEVFDARARRQASGRHVNSPYEMAPDIRIFRLKGSFVANVDSGGWTSVLSADGTRPLTRAESYHGASRTAARRSRRGATSSGSGSSWRRARRGLMSASAMKSVAKRLAPQRTSRPRREERRGAIVSSRGSGAWAHLRNG